MRRPHEGHVEDTRGHVFRRGKARREDMSVNKIRKKKKEEAMFSVDYSHLKHPPHPWQDSRQPTTSDWRDKQHGIDQASSEACFHAMQPS